MLLLFFSELILAPLRQELKNLNQENDITTLNAAKDKLKEFKLNEDIGIISL